MSAPATFEHPTFGPCELVPSIIAIKWVRPLDQASMQPVVAKYRLTVAANASPSDEATKGARDPRPVNVNQSDTLTWASVKKEIGALLDALNGDPLVAWAAPVYRATRAERGPQSCFAIDPTVLFLGASAASALGNLGELAATATLDREAGSRIKGFVTVTLPARNALEIVSALRERAGAQTVAAGVVLQNVPYISPTACGCAGSATKGPAKRERCGPATSDLVPNDTFYGSQWGLQRINAPRAWPISEGDPNIVVAVLDQGVELGHPDLNLWPVSYSTVTHLNDGSPVGNHGTACAGIIGGSIDNALGVAGLAGKCRVMAIATNFADTEVAEGLYFAADNGARVVSMSFGVYPSWMVWNFAIIQAALQYCQDKNVVLVAASGNENQNVCRFPGSDPRTLTVGGSNRADVRKAVGDTSIESFWGACFGPDVDVVAPCLEIPTTDRLGAAGYTPTDYDMRFNGTSSATPHVAALAGLVISVNPGLTSAEVRKIISETTDKINAGPYVYLPTAGKPFGTWTNEVGYGRINAERALLVACESKETCDDGGPCGVCVPTPDECCVSPCDPPWRPDEQCLVFYETRNFRFPLGKRGRDQVGVAAVNLRDYIEFRVTYEHKLCLLGKQHGPLLYTVTLLPGEHVTLYHSDRYRRITSEQDRFSVQTTFMTFLSAVHEARVTNTLDVLADSLSNAKSNTSGSFGGGLAGALGLPSGSGSSSTNVTNHNALHVGVVSEQFNRSAVQASQMVHAERSVVVSTYEDKETANITARTIHNANDCRAVTYFVRKVVELYAFSTRVSDISYRIVAPNVSSDWHQVNDVAWLPQVIRDEIAAILMLLPKVGEVTQRPTPISLPTDGTVYDPELAHCGSCEPERAAAIAIQLEKQKAEAMRACFEAQLLEVELERRRKLIQSGQLGAFETVGAAGGTG